MEQFIAQHCAPALTGIKPSNIVSCFKDRKYQIAEELERLNSQLNCKDIYFEPLCECEKRVLLMVYRKKVLQKTLADTEIHHFLTSLGYPEAIDTDTYLQVLKQRLQQADFPHEIGAFLGYPMHDINGFLFPENKTCLLCGEWKVYENVEEAKKLFARFAACRKATVNRLKQGCTLAQLFCAA